MTELGYLLIAAGVLYAFSQWLVNSSTSEFVPHMVVKHDDWRIEAHGKISELIKTFEQHKLPATSLRQAGKQLYDPELPK